MSAPRPWAHLHDATLEGVDRRWSSGNVTLSIRTGDLADPWRHLVASSVWRLECDRQMPWGTSASIDQVRGPVSMPDGQTKLLEIEMQSGDVLRVQAAEFTLSSGGHRSHG